MVKPPNEQYSGTQKKIEDLLKLGILLVLLIIVNLLARDFFFRIDLTEDKRYSITDATKEVLKDLDEVVYVEVYLAGKVPAGFKRLQRSIRETLEEFRIYAGSNVQYSFIDPTTATSPSAQNEFYRSLAGKGIQPTNIMDSEAGSKSQKLVFPGAVISYGGREKGVMLLQGNQASSTEEKLNQSIEGLEYQLGSAIQELSQDRRYRIGWLTGQGELDSIRVQQIRQAIAEEYILEEVHLPSVQNLHIYDVLLLARPTQAFSEADKFKIDQYLLKGGRGLFFVDMVQVEMEQAGGEGTLGIPYELNLDDLFFRYGIRINKNLVQDLSAGLYPVVVGNSGNQPQVRMMPWPFFPVLNNYGSSAIVRNLDATYSKFVSSVDTVKAAGVTKTPLILTSRYSRVFEAPVRVSINDLRKEINPANYNQGEQPVAYLLEGMFSSVYKNRLLPEGVRVNDFLVQGNTKLIVVADGDFLANEINFRTGESYPLGFAPFTENIFGNQEFVMNALAYLTNENGLILARNKEVRIRPLDPVRLKEEKVFWQVFNLLVPVLLILLLGILFTYWRRRRYTRF